METARRGYTLYPLSLSFLVDSQRFRFPVCPSRCRWQALPRLPTCFPGHGLSSCPGPALRRPAVGERCAVTVLRLVVILNEGPHSHSALALQVLWSVLHLEALGFLEEGLPGRALQPWD